jgi:hypothetical protein
MRFKFPPCSVLNRASARRTWKVIFAPDFVGVEVAEVDLAEESMRDILLWFTRRAYTLNIRLFVSKP